MTLGYTLVILSVFQVLNIIISVLRDLQCYCYNCFGVPQATLSEAVTLNVCVLTVQPTSYPSSFFSWDSLFPELGELKTRLITSKGVQKELGEDAAGRDKLEQSIMGPLYKNPIRKPINLHPNLKL